MEPFTGEVKIFCKFLCFAGPFDVANKVVEFLMMRDGIDVCCTSDDDLTLFQEYNESFKG